LAARLGPACKSALSGRRPSFTHPIRFCASTEATARAAACRVRNSIRRQISQIYAETEVCVAATAVALFVSWLVMPNARMTLQHPPL
jgi:hypothetical protein